MKKFTEQINERLKLNKDTKSSISLDKDTWVLVELSTMYYYNKRSSDKKFFEKFADVTEKTGVRRTILLGTTENMHSTYLYYILTIGELIESYKRDLKEQIESILNYRKKQIENVLTYRKIRIYELPEKIDKDISYKDLRKFIDRHNKGDKNVKDYWNKEDLTKIDLTKIKNLI